MSPRAHAQRATPKDPVDPSDLPSQCRTWDGERRIWIAKARYASDKEAHKTVAKDPMMSAYRCKASKIGAPHFHVGHDKPKRR